MRKQFGKISLAVLVLLLLFGFWPNLHSGLQAQGTTHGIGLTWTATTTPCISPCVATYSVFRSTVSGGPYTSIKTGIAGLSYEDTTVTTGTTYFYVATASVTGYSDSVYSNQASATFLLQAAAPGSLAATSN